MHETICCGVVQQAICSVPSAYASALIFMIAGGTSSGLFGCLWPAVCRSSVYGKSCTLSIIVYSGPHSICAGALAQLWRLTKTAKTVLPSSSYIYAMAKL
ncbi:hypothetical protein DFH06DRAFT_1250011 [Mycena polygramma]|nr:hypothetical protein DFH06DRAFT_1250011 [Mycena polygramma]